MNLNALCFFRPLRRESITKTLLIMKLTGIILIAACLQVSAKGHSQNVTLNMKNAPLQKVFKEINRQTGFQFFYKDALLNQAGKVDINVKDVPVEDVLKQCFEKLPIIYAMVDNTIVIKERPETNDVTEDLPPIKVSGIVVNEKGEGVPGVSVVIKGTRFGTVTNATGFYTINEVDKDAVLIFTATNIETMEVAVAGKNILNVTVKIKISVLDDIQIIGYGQTTRRFKTSSVTTLKSEDIALQPVTNVGQALQGRAAGLSITQTNGSIGSGNALQIRGVGTIAAGNQPLIILDGAILPDPNVSNIIANSTAHLGYINTQTGLTTLDMINPADIESIEILKDADATAIYGSRGSNGVILLTSKKGKIGATRFNVDISTWSSTAGYLPERLTLPAYRQMRKDAFAMGNHNPTTGVAINPITPTSSTAPDLLVWDSTKATADWTDYEFGSRAPAYNVQANLSGGDKRLNFYASGGYFKQKDITLGSPYLERISGDLSLNHTSANDKLKVAFKAIYISNSLNPSRGGINSGGSLSGLPPNMPMYNADGSPYWPIPTITQYTLLTNPVLTEVVKQKNTTNRFTGNMDISYRIINGLNAKLAMGYTYQTGQIIKTSPSTAFNPLVASTTNIPNNNTIFNNFRTFNFEPQLTYNTAIGKGRLEALAGLTLFDRLNEASSITVQGYTSDYLLGSWAAGSTVASKFNTSGNYKFNSVFGRLTYNWDSKYILNLTYRRDGSSRFGPKKQFGNFGAIGAGWIFSKEKLFKDKISWLSFGKIRGSYGTTGNDNINDYLFSSLYTTTGGYYNGVNGLVASNLIDSSISWETARKLDAAIELGFLKDRIVLNANWYRSRSTNMLVTAPVAVQTGFSTYTTNYPAVVENKGWEFELISKNIASQGSFQWTTTFNLTTLKNRLIEFPGLGKSSYATRLKIGYPVNNPNMPLTTEWALVYTGIDTATGLPLFVDTDKNGSINATNDRQYIGSTIPTLYGGLGNSLSYKGVQLDFFFQFSKQLATNWMYGNTYPGQLFNPVSEFYSNYWKKPGDVTKYPRLWTGVASNATTTTLSTLYPFSSAVLKDITYVRLKNVSLSYTLPAKIVSKAKMSKAVVYIRVQNLALWTSDKIYKDPEAIQLRNSTPVTTTLTVGTQISF